jgi:hypothetical protein
MKFIISVIDSQTRSPHTAEQMKAIDDLNVEMQNAGQRIFAGGIDSPSTAIVFDRRDGAQTITEGSFHSGDEFFSGIWIIEVDSLEEAKALANRGSFACNRKVELRPLLG